jgi:hypothetical protein
MSEKKLEEIYQLYLSSIEVYNYAQDRAKSKYEIAHKFKISSKNQKNQLKAIQEHFDKLKTDIKEFYILSIITTFEKIIFNKIQQTRGELEKIINKGYGQRIKNNQKVYFRHSTKSFIKSDTDIFSLGRAIKLLEKQIKDKQLFNDLAKIKEHKDYLSHGKRRNVGKLSKFTIEEIKDKLIEIINSI